MIISNYYFNVSVLLLIFSAVTFNLLAQVTDKDSELPVKKENAVLSSISRMLLTGFPWKF